VGGQLNVQDVYVREFPSDQKALDIFSGEWTSQLPEAWAQLQAGTTPLFDDPRVHWALRELGGADEKTVLELGPLEGGHSYMLEKAGSRSILAIEGNTRAYLRCLVVKEILGLRRVRFLCGDFGQYLKESTDLFDIVFASGVLYHQQAPVELLATIARAAPALYLWTHYYDAAAVTEKQHVSARLGAAQTCEFDGFAFTQHEYRYLEARKWSGFCGGPHDSAQWLLRDDIIRALRHFGYAEISIAFDDISHPNGPSLALVARR
jgi:SAM-dependent methyltransferase